MANGIPRIPNKTTPYWMESISALTDENKITIANYIKEKQKSLDSLFANLPLIHGVNFRLIELIESIKEYYHSIDDFDIAEKYFTLFRTFNTKMKLHLEHEKIALQKEKEAQKNLNPEFTPEQSFAMINFAMINDKLDRILSVFKSPIASGGYKSRRKNKKRNKKTR